MYYSLIAGILIGIFSFLSKSYSNNFDFNEILFMIFFIGFLLNYWIIKSSSYSTKITKEIFMISLYALFSLLTIIYAKTCLSAESILTIFLFSSIIAIYLDK